ncbi:hypothetical protein EV294_11569 [Paenibacillus sp. BK033]|nr:hypothetical protein EV294_11569 [Paenibacillus sp. BK033]
MEFSGRTQKVNLFYSDGLVDTGAVREFILHGMTLYQYGIETQ